MPSTAIPPPALGWNTRDPVMGMKPGFALIFDNVVVEGGAPMVRRGWRAWATGMPGRVDGLLPWNGAGSTLRLFAASGAGIYDVTAGGAVGAAAVSGLTSARWDALNVAASGGNFLFCFNGADTPRQYDGSAWATWAGTGVTGGVSWAVQFNGRLFVGNAGRLSFFYGGAGAIAGAFTEFPLQGVARLGGGICAAASLSVDGGDGPDDVIAFITTEGEVIVYEGTNPGSVVDWRRVGRWTLPRPIGAPHRCVMSYGGDALLMTMGGVLPLSSLRSGQDAAVALERMGLTRRVAQTWRTLATERASASGWGIVGLGRYGLVVTNVPWGASAAQQIVASEGGAVSRWWGLPAACWTEALGGRVFCGDAATGRVLLFGEDLTDGGAGIRSEMMTGYSALGASARLKRFTLLQPVLRDAAAISLDARAFVNWDVPLSQCDSLGASAPAPAVPPYSGGGSALVWNVGNWNQGLWAGGTNEIASPWQSAAALGHAGAVRLRLVSGSSRPAWQGTQMVYEIGGALR